MTSVLADFWSFVTPQPEQRVHVTRFMAASELYRASATYNTGSIDAAEATLLWLLAERIEARVVIEVGTFIGTSTMALSSAPTVQAVYTCDVSNDCFPSGGVIQTYPKQTSTQMLKDLVARGVKADLCFFDGVLSDEDASLLMRVTHPDTVYAVHDYNYGPKIRTRRGVTKHEMVPRKGIGNIKLLWPTHLPKHSMIEPMPNTTVAALVPEAFL